MSVRRRSIEARRVREALWAQRTEESRQYIEMIRAEILQRASERDGHRRMDDDGAPPIG